MSTSTVEAVPVQKQPSAEPAKEFIRATLQNTATAPNGSDQNLEMVRNILFGEQVRESERRQAGLERFVRVSLNAWSEENQKKFDALQRELQTLKDLLTDETQARRADTIAAKDRVDEVGRSLVELDKKQRAGHDDTQGLVQKEVLKLEQTIQATREDLQEQLKKALEQLRSDKADRKSLATMLNNVAKQLNDGIRE